MKHDLNKAAAAYTKYVQSLGQEYMDIEIPCNAANFIPSLIEIAEKQQQEIEKLKIENVTLQPIYSRRQLEEKIIEMEKERDFLKDTRDILINYDGCKTEKQLMGLIDETRLRLSVLLDGKIKEYQETFGE